MSLYRKRTCVFSPKDLTTLREELIPMIGNTYTCRYLWVIEEDEGEYAGQLAYGIEEKEWPGYWCPECDLIFED